MLVVMGIIAIYAETIYTIVTLFGVDPGPALLIGTMPILAVLLPGFPMLFFIAAFAVMVARKYRRR